jgi:formamidopyrimidine-DNA glycosylase
LPELPEVETIVRDLRPHLVGRTFTKTQLLRDSVLRFPDPASFKAGTEGRQVGSVRRRGKFILVGLGDGENLVVHLGMTGSLTLQPPTEPRLPHTHLLVELDDGRELRFRDARRFGRILLGHPALLQRVGVMPRLGPDPLSQRFAQSGVAEVLGRSTRRVKAALLDQAVLAGCGNIYADEACFLARIRPDRRANSLRTVESRRLLAALPVVMREAIRRRGSSFSDYRDGFGAKGEAYESLFVYGRGGLPCVRCGRPLRQSRIGGRTTVYCTQCQR